MEVKVVEIGADGMCKCSIGDDCPLGKRGMETRCTASELSAKGFASEQKEFSCDFCCKKLKEKKKVDTLHYRFGPVTLCRKCYDKQGNRVR